MSIQKPSEPEEEYFARQQSEVKRKMARERQAKLAKEERERLHALHHMRCPHCGMELEAVVFRGIRMDRCFSCGGAFLDAANFSALAGKGHGFIESIARIFKHD